MEIAFSLLERIAPAIGFIHDNDWLHGDVKPYNIFIDSTGLAWLGDCGSSAHNSKLETVFHGGATVIQYDGVCYNSLANLIISVW